MPVEVASIMATLGLDTGPFDKGTAVAGGKIEKFGGMIGTALGGAALAGVGVAAAAIGGIGVAAFGAAGDFEAATNAIITGTGASGDALSGMEEAVKNLRGTSAGLNTDFGTLGAVVAEVSTRTGATGDALETFSGQVLDLSRLTGGDAVENTRLITRVMGDWGVAMDDSGMLMDQLFGASQTFGISVESLSAKVVQFGAPMRQMGFSLEESVALFGKWEQEGVNAELAIGSLRIAAGNFARDNIPLQQGLRDTMAAIKGASTESEGLAIAMDVFGARAGPDMAAAIREGRFELDEAITALQETGGGLADAGERALSLGDKFGIIKNQAGVALLPLGEMLLGLAEDAMPAVQSGLQWFTDTGVPAMVDFGTSVKEWLDEFSERAGPIIEDFSAKWKETAGPALEIIRDALERIGSALGISNDGFSGMGIALGILKGVLNAAVTGLQLAALVMNDIADGVEAVSDAIDIAIGLWGQMGEIAEGVGDKLPDWLKPGSPPPLYHALQDINRALTQMPRMGQAFGFEPPAGGGRGGGGGDILPGAAQAAPATVIVYIGEEQVEGRISRMQGRRGAHLAALGGVAGL